MRVLVRVIVIAPLCSTSITNARSPEQSLRSKPRSSLNFQQKNPANPVNPVQFTSGTIRPLATVRHHDQPQPTTRQVCRFG